MKTDYSYKGGKTFGSSCINWDLDIGVGAAAAEAAMAAPLFARNNVSSMASEVAEPPHFLLPY